MKSCRCMANYFSSYPTNILLCVGIGIGFKSIVKLNSCVQPMHQIYVIKYCIFLKTSLSVRIRMSYQSQVRLFMMIVSRLEKSHCLLKSSIPLPWQPNLIKTLPTGAISKLMLQTREPTPTYTFLNPVSLLWTWHFKHGVYTTHFPFPLIIILEWCSQVEENGCLKI